MKGMEITLKSGAVLTVDAIDLTTERNRISGELVGLKWETPPGAKRKLHTVEISEVAAVVVLK